MVENYLSKIYEKFRTGAVISTDTRAIKTGCVFIALKGPSFNGNMFAREALLLGASLVVVDEIFDVDVSDSRVVMVSDGLSALQDLATMHRRNYQIPVLAIGGSNGKTTTKELVHAVLSCKFRTLATKGNLNNHIGVPLTLLDITKETELAIIEMGSNHPGEMEVLCNIAEPDYGLVTNIGKEHLEGFGNLEGVAKEESMLYQYIGKHNGMAFVNIDDPWLWKMSGRLSKKFTYSLQSGQADIKADLLEAYPGVSALFNHGFEVRSKLPGAFNLQNICAAVAVGTYFGVSPEEMTTAISSYEPSNKRSQVVKKGKYTLIMDCYNANPSSMELAIRSFSDIPGEKALVLGDMLEMGEQSLFEHHYIAELVGKLGFQEVYCVGAEFAAVAEIMKAKAFANSEELQGYFTINAPRALLILLKASRGIQLEKSVETL